MVKIGHLKPAITPDSPVRYGFHQTARWKRLRKLQLAQEPLCKFCLERGSVTAATVADHVEPHKGNWTKFVTGKLQSLCYQCHNSTKQLIELHGHHSGVDRAGLPIDSNHPFNRPR
jgi:5-methylcytosine-specific restriction enzyme A